jgi:polysaccharide biosynthesis transport protein
MSERRPEDQIVVPLVPATPSVPAAAVPVFEPSTAGKVTPVGLLTAFRRKLWPALGLGILLGVPVAAAVWYFLPPPAPRVATTMYSTQSVRGTLFEHPDAVIDRQTQTALIRNKLVMSAALRNPEVNATQTVRLLPGDPVDWLYQAVSIDYPHGPEIVRLSLTVSEPVKSVDDAKRILDAVRNSYLEQIVNKSAADRKERADRLQVLQTQAQDSLRRKQGVFRKLAETVGSSDPQNVAAQQRLIQEQLGMAQRELVKLRSDLRRLRLEEMAAKSTSAQAVPEPGDRQIAQFVEGDPAVRSYLERSAKGAAEMREIERAVVDTGRNATYQRLKAEAETLPKELADARAKARAEYLAVHTAAATGDAKSRLSQLGQQISFQTELETLLVNEIDRLAKSVKSMNTANLDMEAERIDIQQAEQLYSKVSAAISTQAAEQDAPVRVRPLESAGVVPFNADGRKLQYTAAALAGVMAVVGLLFALWEFFQGRVDSPDEIGRACGLTVLGTIPRVPSRLRRDHRNASRWQALLSESMACTRSMIRYGGREAFRPQLLLVTSAGTGEGKTSLACELAISFARGGARTLLIDGDMRQPSAHESFGLAAGPGLAELLRGDQPSEQLVRPVQPNLDFLPAGRCTDATLVALADGRGTADLRRFNDAYDIVIMDSSPVLPVADTTHYARQADAVLMTVLAGYSRTAMVREATRRLRHVGAPLLGLIVNGVTQSHYGYGYGYGTPVSTAGKA